MTQAEKEYKEVSEKLYTFEKNKEFIFSETIIRKSEIIYFNATEIKMVVKHTANYFYEKFDTVEKTMKRVNELAVELGGNPIYSKEILYRGL